MMTALEPSRGTRQSRTAYSGDCSSGVQRGLFKDVTVDQCVKYGSCTNATSGLPVDPPGAQEYWLRPTAELRRSGSSETGTSSLSSSGPRIHGHSTTLAMISSYAGQRKDARRRVPTPRLSAPRLGHSDRGVGCRKAVRVGCPSSRATSTFILRPNSTQINQHRPSRRRQPCST